MKKDKYSAALRGILTATVFGAALLLQGCGTTQIADRKITEPADYGAYPNNYQEIVKTYFSSILIDPDSAKFEFGPAPTKAYTRNAIIPNGAQPVDFGYVVYVLVNSKNRYGGYVGRQEYRLLIRDGRVINRIYPNSLLPEPWFRE